MDHRADWRYVIWWGLPVAVFFAVWFHGRLYGYRPESLLSPQFAIILVVSLVIIGYVGGRVFGAMFVFLFRRPR